MEIIGLLAEDIWNKQTIQSPKESNKVSFSQLKNIEVTGCHNLINVFPSNMLPQLKNLERLCVEDCPSLTLLVEQVNPNNIQSSVLLYLKSISISHCDSLRHVFSAFVARQLACIEKLCVEACSGMEVIVSDARGEGVTDDGIIEFSQLETLKLLNLPNLKSFFQSKFEASHLFNYQVRILQLF